MEHEEYQTITSDLRSFFASDPTEFVFSTADWYFFVRKNDPYNPGYPDPFFHPKRWDPRHSLSVVKSDISRAHQNYIHYFMHREPLSRTTEYLIYKLEGRNARLCKKITKDSFNKTVQEIDYDT